MSNKVSEAEVVSDLKRICDELGHPPKMYEYDEYGEYSSRTVANKFDGSYKRALAKTFNIAEKRQPEIRKEEFCDDIRRVADYVGGEPSRDEYKEHGEYSLSGITYRFGTWNGAKQEAGVYEGLDEGPTKEELLSDMQRVDQEIDEPLSQVRYNEHGKWTVRPVKRRFQSWESACQKAKVSRPNKGPRPADDKGLIEDIQNVADELGHVPSRTEYNENGQFSRQIAINRFGSWPEAVEKAGYEPLPPGGQSGNRNALWVDEEPYYGPNWDKRAEEIRKRDDYECQNCGMSNREHIGEYGSKLNVHHIKKLRNFDSYDAANTGENLITLCNSCHSTYEHLPIRRAKELLGDD